MGFQFHHIHDYNDVQEPGCLKLKLLTLQMMRQRPTWAGEQSIGSLSLDPFWQATDVCARMMPAAHGHGDMEKGQYCRIGEVLLEARKAWWVLAG